MKVKDLKDRLGKILEELNSMDEGTNLRVVYNTYFLRGYNYLATREGFVDLDYLEEDEYGDDDEW